MVGRENGRETEGIRKAMREFTGHEVMGCPWRAYANPLVREVLNATKFLEHGNLAVAHPNPSHRFIEALGFWNQVSNRVGAKLMELERQEREAARKMQGGR